MKSLEQEHQKIVDAVFSILPIDVVKKVLQKVFDGVCDKHDIQFGDDETSFGTEIYRVVLNNMLDYLRKHKIEHIDSQNDFRILVKDGNFEVSFRRVRCTNTLSEDINISFPNSDFCTKSLQHGFDFRQLPLPFEEDLPLLPTPLVIAYIGNSEKGLRGIYLCKPRTVHNGKISSWEFAIEISKAESVFTGYADPNVAPQPKDEVIQRPPLEKVKKPVLKKKKAN